MPGINTVREFYNVDPNVIYLDGNSLGRLPLAAATRIETLVRDGWGEALIRGWNSDWIQLPTKIGDQIGTLIGAASGQCIVADSTSVNLFKLATAALHLRPDRSEIITDATNFPSDLYVLESATRAAGGRHRIKTIGESNAILPETAKIIRALNSDTALVMLSHVTFRSGSLYPMREITEAAHAVGALVLWDLSHSVGVIPIQVDDWNVDLAVGCTYKYLCGGPGAPAFLYVHRTLHEALENPVAGWFSHATPFHFESAYQPADGIQRFLTGTPPVLSLAAIEAGVEIVNKAGVETLRERSMKLTEQFVGLFDKQLADLGFKLRSPRQPDLRGSHISLGHPEARKITQTLITKYGVIPDFRVPDNLRIGFAPLYNDETEVELAVDAIAKTVIKREFENTVLNDSPVT